MIFKLLISSGMIPFGTVHKSHHTHFLENKIRYQKTSERNQPLLPQRLLMYQRAPLTAQPFHLFFTDLLSLFHLFLTDLFNFLNHPLRRSMEEDICGPGTSDAVPSSSKATDSNLLSSCTDLNFASSSKEAKDTVALACTVPISTTRTQSRTSRRTLCKYIVM